MADKRSLGATDRRRTARPRRGSKWPTALTRIEQNRIVVRGFPVDELMGRVSFGEAIYLLLTGELPSAAIGKLLDALLVSSVDHGATPPSTLAARTVASTGAPLRNTVAAGVLSFGTYHGADVEACMRFLDEGLRLNEEGATLAAAAETIVRGCLESGHRPPGFGHRLHTRDPRAARLLQLALELELDGPHVHLTQTVERLVATRKGPAGEAMPLNVDGAIAAVCGDLGFEYEIGNALFIIARVPGLIAHAHEERLRHRPMRLINPEEHVYDGPSDRRLPETRK